MGARNPLIIVLALGIAACSDGMPAPAPSPPSSSVGTYGYRAYDSLAVEVARGKLVITSDDSSSVAGHWSIQAVGTPDDIGPQIGEGELRGYWWHGQLIVDLNPGVFDYNVLLAGRYGFDGQRYKGTWGYSTIAGLQNEGSFTAHRTED